jgi:outer membrane protein assembly factor BamB
MRSVLVAGTVLIPFASVLLAIPDPATADTSSATLAASSATGTVLVSGSAIGDPEPSILWTIDLPDSPQGGMTAGEGRVFVALLDGTLRAYDLADGTEKWKKDLGASPRAGAVYAAGLVLVADSEKKLRAFSAKTGDQVWEAALLAMPSSEIGIGEAMACLGEGNHSCVAFALKDGRKIWRVGTIGDVVGAPWSGKAGTLFGSTGHKLYFVAKDTGAVTSESTLTGEISGRMGGSDAEDSLVALGTHQGRLQAFTGSGAMMWTGKCRGVVRAAPLVRPEAVYAGTDQSFLYAFSRGRGDMKWRTGVGGAVADRLVFLAGWLVVGSGAALNLVNPGDGIITQVLPVGGIVFGVAEEGGVVTVATTNRRLVAVGIRARKAVGPQKKESRLVSVVVDPSRVNPWRGQKARVTFTVREAGSLKVDVATGRGKRVRLLANYDRAWPDTYNFSWDGMVEDGKPAIPGVYRVRVTAGEEEVSVGIEVVGRR